MTKGLPLLLALLLVAPAIARADAPEPRRKLEVGPFMGRWYEIIRTPNDRQRNCHGAYQVWSEKPDGTFNIDQVCHKDSRDGPASHFKTAARILNPPANTKFEASFFGGLIRKKYWVIDHGDKYEWMIASTSDGKFVSLLARTPGIAPAAKATLRARMKALGFPLNNVEDVGA